MIVYPELVFFEYFARHLWLRVRATNVDQRGAVSKKLALLVVLAVVIVVVVIVVVKDKGQSKNVVPSAPTGFDNS